MAKKVPNPRVYPHGRKTYVEFRWYEERFREGFDDEQAARDWALEAQLAMTRGETPVRPNRAGQASTATSKRQMTLEQLLTYATENHWQKKLKPDGSIKDGAKTAMIAARQAVKALGPKTKVAALSYEKIESGLEALRIERGNSESTSNHRKAALSVMFGYAVKLGVIDREPPMEKRAVDNTRSFRVTPSLEEAVLQLAISNNDLDWYDFVVLAIYLGHRENEILRIRLAENAGHKHDPYVDGDVVMFPAQGSKNKTVFTTAVPMRPIVREVIDRRRAANTSGDPSARLFPETCTKKWCDNHNRAMRQAMLSHPEVIRQQQPGEPVGKDFTIHIFRHEFCSRLGDEGFSLHDIAKYSGHKTPQMCQRYVKPHKLALRENALRNGLIDGLGLPGGEVPDFAPSGKVVKFPKQSKKPAPAAVPVAPALDAEAVQKLLDAINAAGLGHLIEAAVSGAKATAAK